MRFKETQRQKFKYESSLTRTNPNRIVHRIPRNRSPPPVTSSSSNNIFWHSPPPSIIPPSLSSITFEPSPSSPWESTEYGVSSRITRSPWESTEYGFSPRITRSPWESTPRVTPTSWRELTEYGLPPRVTPTSWRELSEYGLPPRGTLSRESTSFGPLPPAIQEPQHGAPASGPATPTPQFLFHYTDFSGMRSIKEELYIRKSIPAETNNGAWYGDGVYLTEVPPTAPDNVILLNNWNDDGLASSNYSSKESKFAKLQYCFMIPSNILSSWALEKIRDKRARNIWVYRDGITIRLGENDVILRKRW